jgi:hypothetical protein
MKLEHCSRASCVQIIDALSGQVTSANNNSLYWYNRCRDLEEIIELFCMDAEHERWAPTTETKEQMHRAEFELGKWLSVALDDESNCAEFKKAIIDWMTFSPLENNP